MGQLIIDPIPKCAYTRQETPDIPYGGHAIIRCEVEEEKDEGMRVCHGHIEADFSALPDNPTIINTSKLEFYIETVILAASYSFGHMDTGWDEATITFNNSPRENQAPIISIVVYDAGVWFTITGDAFKAVLEDAIANHGGIGNWSILPNYAVVVNGFQFTSDDGVSNKPKLTIDYTVPVVGGVYLKPNKYLW